MCYRQGSSGVGSAIRIPRLENLGSLTVQMQLQEVIYVTFLSCGVV